MQLFYVFIRLNPSPAQSLCLFPHVFLRCFCGWFCRWFWWRQRRKARRHRDREEKGKKKIKQNTANRKAREPARYLGFSVFRYSVSPIIPYGCQICLFHSGTGPGSVPRFCSWAKFPFYRMRQPCGFANFLKKISKNLEKRY